MDVDTKQIHDEEGQDLPSGAPSQGMERWEQRLEEGRACMRYETRYFPLEECSAGVAAGFEVTFSSSVVEGLHGSRP